MNKKIFAVLLLLITLGFNNFTSAQDNPKDKQENTPAKTEAGIPVNTICPVSTEEADAEFTYEYKGKTYAVCCNSCLKKFKKDPEKYISRLSEDGKSIKKNKGDKK